MTETPQQLVKKRQEEKEIRQKAYSQLSASEKKAEKLRITELKKGFPVETLSPAKPIEAKKAIQKKLTNWGQKQKGIAQKEKKNGTNLRFDDNYPICFISRSEAIRFCAKLTESERTRGLITKNWHYRLPTEAEREYAARAWTNTPVNNGRQPDFRGEKSITEFNKHARIKSNSTNRIHEVAQLDPNDWGFYDMLKNVTEWCLNIHADFTSDSKTESLVLEGPSMMRMYRGLTAHNGPLDIRNARRKVGGPRVPHWTFFGFRVVLARETDQTKNIPDNHTNH